MGTCDCAKEPDRSDCTGSLRSTAGLGLAIARAGSRYCHCEGGVRGEARTVDIGPKVGSVPPRYLSCYFSLVAWKGLRRPSP